MDLSTAAVEPNESLLAGSCGMVVAPKGAKSPQTDRQPTHSGPSVLSPSPTLQLERKCIESECLHPGEMHYDIVSQPVGVFFFVLFKGNQHNTSTTPLQQRDAVGPKYHPTSTSHSPADRVIGQSSRSILPSWLFLESGYLVWSGSLISILPPSRGNRIGGGFGFGFGLGSILDKARSANDAGACLSSTPKTKRTFSSSRILPESSL